MPIDPGVYYVWNYKSNTALGTCIKDDKRVVGWAHHGGESQKWEIGKLGAGWFIRNVNNNHYLNIECGLENGLAVGENEYPEAWAFATEEGQDGNVFWLFNFVSVFQQTTYTIDRIHWPKTRYTLNLSGGYRENGMVAGKPSDTHTSQNATHGGIGILGRVVREGQAIRAAAVVPDSCLRRKSDHKAN